MMNEACNKLFMRDVKPFKVVLLKLASSPVKYSEFHFKKLTHLFIILKEVKERCVEFLFKKINLVSKTFI